MLKFSCFVTGKCGLRYVAKVIAGRFVCFDAETGGTARVKLGGVLQRLLLDSSKIFFTLGWREHRRKFSRII